jgi:copper chaperone CopZ
MIKKFVVDGMHCKSCEILLKDVISEIKGVRKVWADSKKGEVFVEYDDAEDKIPELVKQAIQNEGYKVRS